MQTPASKEEVAKNEENVKVKDAERGRGKDGEIKKNGKEVMPLNNMERKPSLPVDSNDERMSAREQENTSQTIRRALQLRNLRQASKSSLPSQTSMNRTIKHPTRYWETLVHLLKGNIGAGLFAMADAYKNAGLIGGLVGTLFIGGICIYCSHILIWSSAKIRKKLNMDADPSFEETVEYCFEFGPKYYQKTSKIAGILVKVFIVITQLGFCCVFYVFVAESFVGVMNPYLNGHHISGSVYIVSMFFLMMVICLIPYLKFLTPISLAGTIFLFTGILYIVGVASTDIPSLSTRDYFGKASTFPLFFGTVVYAFEGIALIIPLRAEMRRPEKFASSLGVYNVGMMIVMILFNVVGFLGYLKFGPETAGSISFNLEPSVAADVIKIIVALGIMFSYPLQFFVASAIISDAIVHKCFNRVSHKKRLIVGCVVRGSLVTITCAVAIFVPNLGAFISLIGCVSSTALALVFPVLCHISLFTCPEEFEPATSKLLPLWYVLDGLALLLAFLGFITGAYFSSKEIISKFSIPDVRFSAAHPKT
ncbi:hypothetical protein GE061_004750 [Apolygus lucorum]|uniref:Amino acid transporter transmembrane domain-containing protein n=1 Tax=Apolygus lucorum TaxID=248454 RepID=A0A8S9X030_APOLU|nr:hypothetical protein GE061_004750 [Apolygus lucorum]